MKEADKIIQDFTERLKQTREYRLYDEKKKLAQQEPGLWEQISEYRRQNYELQNSKEGLFDKIDDFVKTYEDLMANPLVADYLEAETEVCKMINEIYAQIAEAINLDL